MPEHQEPYTGRNMYLRSDIGFILTKRTQAAFAYYSNALESKKATSTDEMEADLPVPRSGERCSAGDVEGDNQTAGNDALEVLQATTLRPARWSRWPPPAAAEADPAATRARDESIFLENQF